MAAKGRPRGGDKVPGLVAVLHAGGAGGQWRHEQAHTRPRPCSVPWASRVTSLSLAFPNHKTEEMTVSSKDEKVWPVPSTRQAPASWWPRPLSLLTRPTPSPLARLGPAQQELGVEVIGRQGHCCLHTSPLPRTEEVAPLLQVGFFIFMQLPTQGKSS